MIFSSNRFYFSLIFFALVSVNYATRSIVFTLTERQNLRICSRWAFIGNDEFSYSYSPNSECGPDVKLEQTTGLARLCCQIMPVTTPSTDFPTECGKQQYQPLRQRIVGGIHAAANSWPWHVLVSSDDMICGGVLIHQQYVLTAAHCIQVPTEAYTHSVTVGLHDFSAQSEAVQEIVADKVWVHEEFDGPTYNNDIALIRLSKPVEISDKINVICLPGAEVGNLVNQTVWVSGWGNTGEDGGTSVLKQTWLHTMGKYCNMYGAAVFNEDRKICAGRYSKDSGACFGDSGGPLMYESNGQWFLNGIVSAGGHCTEHPGTYTRVSYYLSWITNIMGSA